MGECVYWLIKELKFNLEWGVFIVGYFDIDEVMVGKYVGEVEVLGMVDKILVILRMYIVEEVIFVLLCSMMNDVVMIVIVCEEEGVQFLVMGDLYDFNVFRILFIFLGLILVFWFELVVYDIGKLVIKCFFDIVFIVLVMLIIVFVMVFIVIVIKLDDGGLVFFIQEWVGFYKCCFLMVKFCIMCIDVEQKLKELEYLNEVDGLIFKMKCDFRVIWVGVFFCKISLDEIFQLLNVLWGYMSLIGLWLMLMWDVDLFDWGIQCKRFSVKLGLICIWQIFGCSDLLFEKWLELDLEYIDNWLFWLDIKIFVLMVFVVLKGSGVVQFMFICLVIEWIICRLQQYRYIINYW